MEKDCFCGTPTLETKRLLLRKFELSDAQDVYDYAKNPEVPKYATWEAHKSIEDAISYIEFVRSRYENNEAGEWGIVLKSSGKLIGAIAFVHFEAQNSCGEIGYALSYDHWNSGIMTEAAKRIIRFAFEDMGINRVFAIHAVENPASGKVMQKANMAYEGQLRQRMFAKDKFWDVKQYAILKEDWLLLSEDMK